MTRAIGKGIRDGVRRWFVLALRSDQRTRQELEEEVRAHIDARVDYLVAHGTSADAARADALARFGGNFDEAMTVLQASAAARDRKLTLRDRMASFGQDARFMLRGLRRAPVFSAGVIATFALGLGVNSAVFRVADRVLVRAPAGVVDPWSLRRVNVIMGASSSQTATEANTMSFPQAQLVTASRAFTQITAYASARGLRRADGRDLAGMYVDSGFFTTLGIKPAAGRFFDAREAEPGAEVPVAIVSYDYWQNELGGMNPAALTQAKIGDRQYQIIGVTPRGFTGVDLDPIDVWLPLGVAALGRGTINGTPIPWYRMNMMRGMHVIGRIGAGESDRRVTARAGAALTAADGPFSSPVRSVVLRSITASSDASAGDVPANLLGRLAGIAIVVLLITCANAANLLLARALRRRREIAVRVALGAGRVRIVRLLVVESVTLGLAGGAAAALAGYWTGDALRRLLFPDAHWTSAALDDRALYFTLGIALMAGLIAGLAPALQLSSPDLVSGLKDNRHQPGRRSRATRSTLVVVQVAFSLVLLIASGLLVRSLQKLNSVAMGFEAAGLVTADVSAPGGSPMPGGSKASAQVIEARELAERMRRYPGVLGVALASNVPFGAHASTTISVPGQPAPDSSAHDGPWFSVVSANYFTVMGTRAVQGRFFGVNDVRGSQPVAIVNVAMARLFWQDANPFRSCLLVHQSCAQVVGVVEDIRDTRGGGPASPRFYLPLTQQDDSSIAIFSANAIVVRTTTERAAAVSAAIKASVPPPQRVTTEVISDRIARTMRPWRLATMLFAGLGAVALLLACIGVYSVMSYIASERIPELGVRIALGASAGDIVRLVLASGLRLVAGGAAVGLIAAAFGARLLASLLFGVSPLDPLVYAGAVVIFGVIGVSAMVIPAVRVMRTDPTVALRAD